MHLDAKSASRPHCDGQQHQQHRSQTVSPTATTTATAAATSAVAVANAVAKPLDKARPMRTAVECPSSTQAAMDGPGRCAHSYGSEGWGFESLRARPGQRPVALPAAGFLVVLGATLEATGSYQPSNRAWLINSAAARLSPSSMCPYTSLVMAMAVALWNGPTVLF